MTPAITLLEKQNIAHIIHQYTHQSGAESYGLEAAEKLNLNASQVFKTLVVSSSDGELFVAIVPVTGKLNLKNMAKAAKVRKVQMAQPDAVERSTGYVLGGVSPFGQKKRLKTVIDETALKFETIFVSAGRRGLEIELAPQIFQSLLNATFAKINTH